MNPSLAPILVDIGQYIVNAWTYVWLSILVDIDLYLKMLKLMRGSALLVDIGLYVINAWTDSWLSILIDIGLYLINAWIHVLLIILVGIDLFLKRLQVLLIGNVTCLYTSFILINLEAFEWGLKSSTKWHRCHME